MPLHKLCNHMEIEKTLQIAPPIEYLKTMSRLQMREHWLIAVEWMKIDQLACVTFCFTRGRSGIYSGMPQRSPPYGSYNNDPFDRQKMPRVPIKHIEFGVHDDKGEQQLTQIEFTDNDHKVIKGVRSNNTINKQPEIVEMKDKERLVGAKMAINWNTCISIRMLMFNADQKGD